MYILNSFLETPIYFGKTYLISHTYIKTKQNISQIEKIYDKFQIVGIGNVCSWVLKGSNY